MNNIFCSKVTLQILHLLLSSRKYKTVNLLLTNFKVDMENHITIIITDSLYFFVFYGDTKGTLEIEMILQTHPTCFHIEEKSIYKHTLLSLHYILTRKIHIKNIIETKISLRI